MEINTVWFWGVHGIALALFCLGVVLLFWYRNKYVRLSRELERKATDLEMQVEKAQAAAQAKSDFLSRMSHEIRTPLNAIIGMVQVLRKASEPQQARDGMDKMENNTRHLLGIINDILDFSKIESGNLTLQPERFSLQLDMDFITSLFKDRVQEKKLDLRVELLDIAHDGVWADKLRLNQVLVNLLSNAVKFTDPGGQVKLSVEEMVHSGGESVFRFSVQDSGVGIAPEQAKKLFTPFTQANGDVSRLYGGTGLGLSISQSIVRMMGGEIELETQLGEGSLFQFTVRVPVQERLEEAPHSSPDVAPPAKLRGKRLWVVDDIEINREIILELLADSGAHIETAKDGREALSMFESLEGNRPDVILMDMLMPVMDGLTATRGIRASGKPGAGEVKILAMTANVLPEDMKRAREAGMDGYLAKPIELETLYARLEECL